MLMLWLQNILSGTVEKLSHSPSCFDFDFLAGSNGILKINSSMHFALFIENVK